jgi:bacillolysin
VSAISREMHANRRLCGFAGVPRWDSTCRQPYTRQEGQAPSGVVEVDRAWTHMGATDEWFRSRFGRNGIDGKGAAMVATVRYCYGYGCPMRNAIWRWAAQQAVFGRGWATDDIVGHEYTHGIVDHEARLFYHFQSGAINESFADIFGELIDQSLPLGNDRPGSRWKIGEDLPGGTLRDMADPPRFRHPDRVSSPYWQVGPFDDGGVHTNSGVGNKAAALMVDGGSFNGYVVNPLGAERVARIHYLALTSKLTPASDYLDLGDALVQSCVELAGTMDIRISHCSQVHAAVRATEMHLRPQSSPPLAAPTCTKGSVAVNTFFDDMEDPARGAWKSGRLVGARKVWYYPPNPSDNPARDARWSASGDLNLYGADRAERTDGTMTLRKAVTLPEGAYLRFAHGFGFDGGARASFDGGVVEISLDRGPWQDAGPLFTHAGYNGQIAKRSESTLRGRRAFTGRSRGYTASRIDLSGYAGSRLRVRFRIATDRKVGGEGWYIDDFRVYRCLEDGAPPEGSVTLAAGAGTTTEPVVRLDVVATDDSGVLKRLLVSNSPEMSGERLAKALLVDFTARLEWDLTDPAWGGSADPGAKTVYVQVRDAAGRWSAVLSDDIELLAAP